VPAGFRPPDRYARAAQRIWARDHTLWRPEPREIADRLGWLTAPELWHAMLPELKARAQRLLALGTDRIVLLGMGGSSLAPEVLARIHRPEGIGLEVVDTTNPDAVARWARELDPARTLFLVSTKSGTTVETLSLFRFAFDRARQALGSEAPSRFVAITDPGSPLEATARRLGFADVFLNDPRIGGRFAALSHVGLVPASLLGLDVHGILDRARAAAFSTLPLAGEELPAAAALGAWMAEMARRGRDKLTLWAAPPWRPFGAWAEQLVAESTGKDGTGILPVLGEEEDGIPPEGPDRFLVHLASPEDPEVDASIPAWRLEVEDPRELGAQFFLWEMATAVAGFGLGVQPFDQPDVEAAKAQARELVRAYAETGRLPEPEPIWSGEGWRLYGGEETGGGLEAILREFLRMDAPQYLALQAYLPPWPEVEAALERIRRCLRRRTGCAVTVGLGPRYLHSTGQLHKGDGGGGRFLQLLARWSEDPAIPEGEEGDAGRLTFGVLHRAQALGDAEALRRRGRRVLTLELGADPAAELARLEALLESLPA
jgi:glucose-6-phosphate isomerase